MGGDAGAARAGWGRSGLGTWAAKLPKALGGEGGWIPGPLTSNSAFRLVPETSTRATMASMMGKFFGRQ